MTPLEVLARSHWQSRNKGYGLSWDSLTDREKEYEIGHANDPADAIRSLKSPVSVHTTGEEG